MFCQSKSRCSHSSGAFPDSFLEILRPVRSQFADRCFGEPIVGGHEEIAAGRLRAPDVIKMDIEGGELEAIPGRRTAWQNARTVFIATHGPEARALVESPGGLRSIELDESVRQTR